MATEVKLSETKKKREHMEAALRAVAASGPLTPERVIQVAKNPRSPLHSYFAWDDKKAARAYRLDQARTLISSVEVVKMIEDRPVTVKYYVRDPRVEASVQGYVGLDDLEQNPEWAQSHMQQEVDAVVDRLRRAEGYAAILQLKPAVIAVRRSAQKLSARVRGAALGATP